MYTNLFVYSFCEILLERIKTEMYTYLIVDGYIRYSRSGASKHVMRIVGGEFSGVIQTAAAIRFSDNVTTQTHRLVFRI